MDLTAKKDKIQTKIQTVLSKEIDYNDDKYVRAYKFIHDGVNDLIRADRTDLANEIEGLDQIRLKADYKSIAEEFGLASDEKDNTNNVDKEEVIKDGESNVDVNENKNDTVAEQPIKSTGKKKIKIEGEKSVVKDKLGLGVRTDAIKEIDTIVKAYKKNGIKSNASLVVEKALETVFNNETGKYNLEVQPKADLKTTTFSVDKKYIDALDDLAETTNVSKSELFDMLIRLGLNNLYE